MSDTEFSKSTDESLRQSLAAVKPRVLLGISWVLAMILIFFKAADYTADELGYELNVEAFAGMLVVGLAFVGLSAVVVKLFRFVTD